MGRSVRAPRALSMVGAVVAALTLSGAAVFAVTSAGCADPGRFVQRDGVVELVGGCLRPEVVPAGPRQGNDAAHNLGAGPAPTSQPPVLRQ